MDTIGEHFKVAVSWMLSFVRSAREPEHYPVGVRKQHDAAPENAWVAYVLKWPGPSGLGATEQEARSDLMKSLRDIAAYRRDHNETMPRPGTTVPIEFASTDRVSADPSLLDDFINKGLGFSPGDPVFISDISSIEDFGDDDRVHDIKERIRENYGVELMPGDSTLISDVLDRIRNPRR